MNRPCVISWRAALVLLAIAAAVVCLAVLPFVRSLPTGGCHEGGGLRGAGTCQEPTR